MEKMLDKSKGLLGLHAILAATTPHVPFWEKIQIPGRPKTKKVRRRKTRATPLIAKPFYNKAAFRIWMKVRRADQLRGKEANLDHIMDVPKEMVRVR